MRGRKPALRIVDGGSRQSGDKHKRPARRCPAAPAWLSKHAKAEWKRAAPDLALRALLSPETQATLETYCTAAGTVRELEETMAAEGRFAKDAAGNKVGVHPAYKMQLAAMREARLLAAELGLTPHRRAAAKGKLPAKKEDTGDGWDGLLA